MARRLLQLRLVRLSLCLFVLAVLGSAPSSSAEPTQVVLILVAESPQAVEMAFPLEDVQLFRVTFSQLYVQAPRFAISILFNRLRSAVDWTFQDQEESFLIRFSVPSGSEIRFGNPNIEMPGPGETRPGTVVHLPAEFRARSFETDGVHVTGDLWIRLSSESIRVELFQGGSSR